MGDIVYFIEAEPPPYGRSLWRTDGTPAGTYRIELFPGFNGGNPTELTRVGARLFFIANDGVNPRSLYYYVPRPPEEEITRLVNLSSRGEVRGGEEVLIGGFVVGAPEPKRVAIVANGNVVAESERRAQLAQQQLIVFPDGGFDTA